MYHNFLIYSPADGDLGQHRGDGTECCNQYQGISVFLNYGFLRVYAQ